MAEVITEYPFPNVKNGFAPLKLVDKTGKGFTAKCRTKFYQRHAHDPRLCTAYAIKLGDKKLHKYGSTFGLCNSVEITIEPDFTSKKGEKGYLLTEKDDEGTNTYFVNEDTLQVTTIQGELVHFMLTQQTSFATQKVAQDETGEVKSVEWNQTRPVAGQCHACGC